MLTESERLAIADTITRQCDTVTLLTCEEVLDIRSRALAGEFDDYESDRLKARTRKSLT